MAATSARHLRPTTVEEMPPLAVTRTGIPAAEHLDTRRAARSRHRRDVVTWSVAGAAALLVAIGMVVTYPTLPTNEHMGLSGYAWSQYRAGERVAPVPTAVVIPAAPASPFDAVPLTGIPPIGP